MVRAHGQCDGFDETYETFEQARFHGEAHLLHDCSDRNCFVSYSQADCSCSRGGSARFCDCNVEAK